MLWIRKEDPVERLATAWTWDSDGLSLRITLRPGVHFHDGRPLTGPVVAAILRQQLNTSGFEAVDHVEAPDNGSVVFHLSRPDAFLIQIIAGALIVDENNPDVGTGPFRDRQAEARSRGGQICRLLRGSPGIERVKVLPFDTQRAAWAALMRGEVDMVQEVNRDSVEFLEGATRISVYSSLRPFYIPLVFNLRHPILKQVEVRRALSEAINRDEIVTEAMGGRGQVADDPVWPSHWAYNPAAPRYSYNPGAARIGLIRWDCRSTMGTHGAQWPAGSESGVCSGTEIRSSSESHSSCNGNWPLSVSTWCFRGAVKSSSCPLSGPVISIHTFSK